MSAHLAGQSKYIPINNYGMIGDLHTIALISPRGSIDWCCFPFFDSASMFASILDEEKGGRFTVYIEDYTESHLTYLTDTNILSNTMVAPAGTIEIVDYMPIDSEKAARADLQKATICRHIECKKGVNVPVHLYFNPRPDYGQPCELEFHSHGVKVRDIEFRLMCTHPVEWDEASRKGKIVLSHGDSARIILCYNTRIAPDQIESWSDRQLFKTRQYWETWLNQCLYTGRWRRMVERSALTLKLLTYQPSGAILAAPTTSLPESLGGSRNWDYRFSWLRDSALILNALLPLGFVDEAKNYVDWVIRKRPEQGQPLPILYSIGDVDRTREQELEHLSGYMDSSPVRIGNAACDQVQLDVYGEVIDCLYIYCIFGNAPSQSIWSYIEDLAERICNEWQQKDEGIWEVRGDKQHFTYSKLMCWIGLDRALRIGRDFGFSADFGKWDTQRTAIFQFIMNQCVDPQLRYLTQSQDNAVADASNLLAVTLSFLPADHPVMMNTTEQTLRQLTDNGMVFRYLNDDGLEGHEGTFNICTFWLIEALAMQDRLEDAERIFNQMLERSSTLGLYAEETRAEDNFALGNFPQAFSHLGLINAAVKLNMATRARQRAAAKDNANSTPGMESKHCCSAEAG